jgi:hypothetical protein
MTRHSSFKVIFLASFLVAVSGCATGVKRGVVAMKISDSQAHVGIGGSEVSVGDHVELYRNACTGTGPGRSGDIRVCKKQSSGHGEITEILNQDYSVVQFPKGTSFTEGDMIEKHSH